MQSGDRDASRSPPYVRVSFYQILRTPMVKFAFWTAPNFQRISPWFKF